MCPPDIDIDQISTYSIKILYEYDDNARLVAVLNYADKERVNSCGQFWEIAIFIIS